MHNYEIKENPNYGNVLFKDGKEVFCPFQPPVATQGMGGMGLMRLPCCTNCLHANLEEDNEAVYDIETNKTLVIQPVMRKVHYVTTCGCKGNRFEVMIAVGKKIDL